jgi:hypothetical protein
MRHLSHKLYSDISHLGVYDCRKLLVRRPIASWLLELSNEPATQRTSKRVASALVHFLDWQHDLTVKHAIHRLAVLLRSFDQLVA